MTGTSVFYCLKMSRKNTCFSLTIERETINLLMGGDGVGLTQRQRAFADEYLICGNATEAYKKAGYKTYKSAGVEANKALNNPKIAAYVRERLEKIESARIADAEEIMEFFTSVMRGEIKDKPMVIAERTKAAIELAKRKIDIQSKDTTGGVTIVNNIPRPEPSPPD